MAGNERNREKNESRDESGIKPLKHRLEQKDPIGKTSSPFKEPNTTGVFCFWIRPGVRLNPFDFVVAEQSDASRTIGIIEEIFAHTDSDSHLTNYIGDELGDPIAEPYVERVSAMVARAQVLRNIREDKGQELYMPVPAERKVFFADEIAIRGAMGYDRIIGTPIPAGLITQSNGDNIPVSLDSAYILGPEGAHANATGISGLATKTSYLMFLIYSIFQHLPNASAILFNVKHADLLHIDEPAQDLTDKDKEMYVRLGMKIKPFENVTYFLPRGLSGQPASEEPPPKHKIYAYRLEDIYDELDLLFSEVPDPQFTLDAFVAHVRSHWESGKGVIFETERGGKTYARTWEDLKKVDNEIIGSCVYGLPRHVTPPRLKRELRRLTDNPVFTNQSAPGEDYLGDAVRKNVQPGHISVVDIYRIPTITQPFIIGDVMRNVEELYHRQDLKDIPYLIIFIDELNTFAPASESPSPITEQIIEIARKGRGRRMALFGAQQFKSEVHKQVWGNCTINVMGRTGSAELRTAPYGELGEYGKNAIMNLAQGEMILSFRVWRYPVKVTFPKPPYRTPSRSKTTTERAPSQPKTTTEKVYDNFDDFFGETKSQ